MKKYIFNVILVISLFANIILINKAFPFLFDFNDFKRIESKREIATLNQYSLSYRFSNNLKQKLKLNINNSEYELFGYEQKTPLPDGFKVKNNYTYFVDLTKNNIIDTQIWIRENGELYYSSDGNGKPNSMAQKSKNTFY